MLEVWKTVPGFNGRYKVSDQGRVYSKYSKRFLKPKTDKSGYKIVALSKAQKVTHIGVHRLVAFAFIDNPQNKPCVNHKNEIKDDNRASNIEWVTVKENDNYGTRNERMAQSKKKKPIAQFLKTGEKINIFAGVKDAMKKTGVNRNCIREVCQGRRKTAGGYRWAYIEEAQ